MIKEISEEKEIVVVFLFLKLLNLVLVYLLKKSDKYFLIVFFNEYLFIKPSYKFKCIIPRKQLLYKF